jgi:hypothetical protein
VAMFAGAIAGRPRPGPVTRPGGAFHLPTHQRLLRVGVIDDEDLRLHARLVHQGRPSSTGSGSTAASLPDTTRCSGCTDSAIAGDASSVCDRAAQRACRWGRLLGDNMHLRACRVEERDKGVGASITAACRTVLVSAARGSPGQVFRDRRSPVLATLRPTVRARKTFRAPLELTV